MAQIRWPSVFICLKRSIVTRGSSLQQASKAASYRGLVLNSSHRDWESPEACLPSHISGRSWDIAHGKHHSIHKSSQFIHSLFYLFEKQNFYNPIFLKQAKQVRQASKETVINSMYLFVLSTKSLIYTL